MTPDAQRAITTLIWSGLILFGIYVSLMLPQYPFAGGLILGVALLGQVVTIWPMLRDDFWMALVHLDKWLNDKWLRGRWETMSGRMQRRFLQGKCPLCGWVCAQLDRIDPGHCKRAYLNDRINHPDLPI